MFEAPEAGILSLMDAVHRYKDFFTDSSFLRWLEDKNDDAIPAEDRILNPILMYLKSSLSALPESGRKKLYEGLLGFRRKNLTGTVLLFFSTYTSIIPDFCRLFCGNSQTETILAAWRLKLQPTAASSQVLPTIPTRFKRRDLTEMPKEASSSTEATTTPLPRLPSKKSMSDCVLEVGKTMDVDGLIACYESNRIFVPVEEVKNFRELCLRRMRRMVQSSVEKNFSPLPADERMQEQKMTLFVVVAMVEKLKRSSLLDEEAMDWLDHTLAAYRVALSPKAPPNSNSPRFFAFERESYLPPLSPESREHSARRESPMLLQQVMHCAAARPSSPLPLRRGATAPNAKNTVAERASSPYPGKR